MSNTNVDRYKRAKFTRSTQINAQAAKIEKNRARYEAVEKVTGVPWDVIAVIHYRESSGSFAGVLHNGQKIIGTNKKTTIVPKGRGPFATWEEAAVDALMNCHPFAGKNKDWSLENTLDILERYNGLGYRNKGLPSPYLWAGTDQYTKGKYVADGKYDPNYVDKQLGVVPILMKLREDKAKELTTVDPEEPTEDMIYKVQELLRAKGYPEVGNVDGRMGDRTHDAILIFQRNNGLVLDGEISDELLIALVKAPVRQNSEARTNATEKDLKEAPSIKIADQLKKIGITILTGSGIGALFEGTGDIADTITSVNKAKALWETLASVSPWLIGCTMGGLAIYYGSKFIKEQVEAYREGRHV